MKEYDLIILGAGPAGITSAVYAARKGLKFLVITGDIGGQTAWSGDIENYTGYQFISGPELTLKFQEHMESFNSSINMPETLKAVKRVKNLIEVVTDKNKYSAKSIIIATGKHPRPLEAEGEIQYKNKGLTYCATCDGPLFKDKKVAVIGGGNSGLDAALQLMKICPQVYIINVISKLTADKVMIEKAESASNVTILNNSKVTKVYGDNFVRGIEITNVGAGSKPAHSKLEVEGVFVEIGLMPNSGFSSELKKNEKGEIIVDCRNQTNIKGVFSAGDVTDVPQKQIIIACGEGAKACLSAAKYILSSRF